MVDNKRSINGMAWHALIVAGTAMIALGALYPTWSDTWLAVLLVTIAHTVIDLTKVLCSKATWIKKKPMAPFWLFLGDQLAHLGSLLVIAWGAQNAWDQGAWGSLSWSQSGALLTGLCLIAGALLVVRAGGFAVAFLLQGLSKSDPGDDGLTGGGTWIGYLERILIFFLVLVQQFQAIGFLIAAKSILRFRTDQGQNQGQERDYSEIVIIGTLASFTWAIIVSWLTLQALRLLR
jgi:hypothetical protein